MYKGTCTADRDDVKPLRHGGSTIADREPQARGHQKMHGSADGRWVTDGIGDEASPAPTFASHVERLVGSVGRSRRHPGFRKAQDIVSILYYNYNYYYYTIFSAYFSVPM